MSHLGNWCLPDRCALCRARSAQGYCARCAGLLPWIEISCEKCGKPAAAPGLCRQCRRRDHAIDCGLISFRYEAPISDHIKMLKYAGQLHLAGALGKSLALRFLKSGLPTPQALVPVPLHPRRQKQRGFNQSTEIAQVLSHMLRIPLADRALVRRVNTVSQAGLDEAMRKTNVRGCFAAGKTVCRGHLALVDDVVTSGSTLREAAAALRQAGAAAVSAWAVSATWPGCP